MAQYKCFSPSTLRGGMHPDYIQSVYSDLVPDDTENTRSYVLVLEPVHIVSVHVALVSNNVAAAGTISDNTSYYSRERYEPLTVSLFTTSEWSSAHETKGGFRTVTEDQSGDLDSRCYISTCSLTTSTQTSWTSPPEMFGMFCDGGLYVECMSPIGDDQGGRIVVNYVPRVAFPPAYADPLDQLKRYWACSQDKPFLEGFYGGTVLNYNPAVSGADMTAPAEAVPDPTVPPQADLTADESFGSSGYDSTGSFPI